LLFENSYAIIFSMFGIYPEWSRNQKAIPNPLLPSPEHDQRLYEAECQTIFDKLCHYDRELNGQVCLSVRLSENRTGLIPKETFRAKDPADGKERLFAFIVLPEKIGLIGPLTPKALKKLELVQPDWRFTRLMSMNERTKVHDIAEDEDRETKLDSLKQVLNQSIEGALAIHYTSGLLFPLEA
jgi:hypothetical protein